MSFGFLLVSGYRIRGLPIRLTAATMLHQWKASGDSSQAILCILRRTVSDLVTDFTSGVGADGLKIQGAGNCFGCLWTGWRGTRRARYGKATYWALWMAVMKSQSSFNSSRESLLYLRPPVCPKPACFSTQFYSHQCFFFIL